MGEKKLEEKDWDFLIQEICSRIGALTGNIFEDRQRPMIESRLRRRLRLLNLDPAEYMIHWKKNAKQEEKELVALLTTHFTSFFREMIHFEWIEKNLKIILENMQKEGRQELRIWSSACSKGQEVWSLAMWLHYYQKQAGQTFKWSILGTDIDVNSVEEASNGVYHKRELEAAPIHLWNSHWQRGQGEVGDWYKVKSYLRENCKFEEFNLLLGDFVKKGSFDIIFCRNVLIYFNELNQKKSLKSLVGRLTKNGILITGVSESLSHLDLPILSLGSSVYAPVNSIWDLASKSNVISLHSPAPVNNLSLPHPLKVLCVDDSPTVLSLLKKILSADGFLVVGTAKNGQEALEKYKELKPDVMTLDLHMPVMDGFEVIEKTEIPKSIPVVVLSTVDRSQVDVMNRLFKGGIGDFIEKPTLENLPVAGEEIKSKLKISWMSFHKNRKSFIQSIESPLVTIQQKKSREKSFICINIHSSQFLELKEFLDSKNFVGDEIIFLNQPGDKFFRSQIEVVKKYWPQYTIRISELTNEIYSPRKIMIHLRTGELQNLKLGRENKWMIYAEEGSESLGGSILWNDKFPLTSMVYMVERYLNGNS